MKVKSVSLRFGVSIYFFFFMIFPIAAQDENFILPIGDIEKRLNFDSFKVLGIVGVRFDDDFTKRATLQFADSIKFRVKWKRAPKNGDAANNSPRYELAAYQFQKLFLAPEEYVVPPTVISVFPIEKYREIEEGVKPTFKNTTDVVFVMQYWLQNVTPRNVYDKKRLQTDTTYTHYLANMNLFSYLVKHMDSNIGNFLISKDEANPRIFSVDNGLTFGTKKSTRGTEWKELQLKQYPRKTIARLRKLKPAEIESRLGVVAQFEIQNGHLVPVNPTEILNKKRGIRRNANMIQLGLTEREIKGVMQRLQRLLDRVDSGKIKMF